MPLRSLRRAPRSVRSVLGVLASAAVALVALVHRDPVILALGLAATIATLGLVATLNTKTASETRLRERLEHERVVRDRMVRSARLEAVVELAAGVAHEVNNPLTSVLGYTELLLATTPANGPQRPELETIRAEANRARDVIRSLLDFARPRPPEHEPTDLGTLVGMCVDLVRHRAVRDQVRVVESYGPVPRVDVDAVAIERVVGNILANALVAMPDGGTLRVSVAADRDQAVVTVEDDGHGMDEAMLARAFLPFASGGRGKGLGLPIALGLVEAHDGSIQLSSATGGGTKAEIRLPIAPVGLELVRAQPAA